MQSAAGVIVILGTGGTIAGTASSATDQVGYRAGQLGVQSLIDAVPALRGLPLEAEQVAQIDSKDMTAAIWQRLAQRVAAHLDRPEVAAVVVNHGTDTLEETAYFLHRVLAPAKPVVLTAAMRPATSLQADGPQNLLDAVAVAREPGARGVVAVIAGQVFSGAELRKSHTYRLDAFDAGDAGALGAIEQGLLRRWRDWPSGVALGLAPIDGDSAGWPRVEIVTSHAGSDGAIVDALVAQGVAGIVAAAVGNGNLHAALAAALARAAAAGVAVAHATRCARGVIVGSAATALSTAALSPVQARIELLLGLLLARHRAAGRSVG
jgi:L-asparaginase